MDSISPRALLQRADWRDYLRIALHNLTPRGYQPHHAPLASQDGNRDGRRRQQQEQEQQQEHEEGDEDEETLGNEFAKEYARLPPMSWEEKVIVADFVMIALAWFFRDPKGASGSGRGVGWCNATRIQHPPFHQPYHTHTHSHTQASPAGRACSPSPNS